MKKNILIVGGSGKLATFLINNLIEKNNLIILSRKKKIFLHKTNKKFHFYKCELENEKKLSRIISKIKIRFKKIDILIFVSAIHGKIASFDKISLKEYKKIFQINFFSFLKIIQTLLENLKRGKNGSVIVFSGGGVTFQRPLFSGYSCSKISLVKFIETISSELKKYSINVNAIAPGVIDSRLFRESQKFETNENVIFGKKSKILNLIKFLVQKKNKKITGKLLSAQWDDIKKMKLTNQSSDSYTLRRLKHKKIS